ncbi:hypothetical protein ABIB14_002036 [Arthrobacter sp. UYEF3]
MGAQTRGDLGHVASGSNTPVRGHRTVLSLLLPESPEWDDPEQSIVH